MFLLPNGVDTESFQPEAPNEAWTNKLNLTDKVIFTFAGRLGYAQGLDSILQAAKIVQEKNSTYSISPSGRWARKTKSCRSI